jgi:N-acetylglucosamine-6-phosphate deacetylase
MTEYILYNALIALPDEIWAAPKNGLALHIKNGKIKGIVEEKNLQNLDCEKIDLGGGILSAGFVDTQVNGGGGALFNAAPNIQSIRTIRDAHLKFGTTSLLPTFISDDFDKMTKAINAMDEAIESGEGGILGIHLEGPFLSEAKKGVHDKSKFKIIDTAALALLTKLKSGKTLVTLAPETAPQGVIKELVQNGVIVAAGHSNADFDKVQKAIEEGLSGFTHLFNAMSQLEARTPNMVGAALSNPKCISGIILDLVHVHGANIRLAYNVLGPKCLMLVTDAMSCVGTIDKEFYLYGKKIEVRDGSCFDENGTLAGSALDMASAVRNLHKKIGIPLGECLQMASETPARFLGLENNIGSIRIGLDADLVLLNENIEVLSVWQKGNQIIH